MRRLIAAHVNVNCTPYQVLCIYCDVAKGDIHTSTSSTLVFVYIIIGQIFNQYPFTGWLDSTDDSII